MESKPATVHEFFKTEILKLNDLKKIGDFIDSCIMFYIKECKYINRSNCSFVDDLMKVYILNCRDENYENQLYF